MRMKLFTTGILAGLISFTSLGQCLLTNANDPARQTFKTLQDDDDLSRQKDELNLQRLQVRHLVCEIFKINNLENLEAPYRKRFKTDDFKFKVKREKDGDFQYALKLSEKDIEWFYKVDVGKNKVEVTEILESPEFEYVMEKNGNEVLERINGASFNYIYDKNDSETTETYASEDKFWTIEKENNGKEEVFYDSENEELKFKKNGSGKIKYDYEYQGEDEEIKLKKSKDGSGELKVESRNIENSRYGELPELNRLKN